MNKTSPESSTCNTEQEVKEVKMKKKKTEIIEDLEKEKSEFKDKWLRTLAEFENYRKNSHKEKQDWIKYANEKVFLEFCDVLDNFERALSTDVNSENYSSYIKGVEMIFQQMNSIFKKNDVIKIDALGKEFDPNYHEAWSSIPALEPENIIVAIVQNGYMLGEKVIRASRVAVSNGEKPE
ncbi:MAG: nucleotide exchange factor GrpE [Candidatus Cloacimonetes bacterium]|nr:nucleotide exchange factor GrpE [Candidatus Cloacimonadota bacterium]